MSEAQQAEEADTKGTEEAEPLPDTAESMTVGEWTIPLKYKGGASATYAIVNLGCDPQTQLIGWGAALGFMWENHVGLPRYPLRAQYRKMARRWADYGAAVVDELIAKGIPMGEINVAGALAWHCMWHESNLWPKESEVKAAEEN